MFDHRDVDIGVFSGESDEELYQLTLAEERRPRDRRHWLPGDLESMLPGPFLAAVLSVIDPCRLSGSDAVRYMQAWQRQTSHAQSRVYAGIVEVARCVEPHTTERSATVNEYAIEEVGAALSMTRRGANAAVEAALDVGERIPGVGAALEAGLIDDRRARVLTRGTDHLETEAARRVVASLLPKAPELTTGQLRARLRRLCIEADPEDARMRYQRSLSERKVMAEENPEGTAALIISECAPDDIYAARAHINMLARRLKTEDEPRNIDQLRADVAIELLTGGLEGESRGRGRVDIRVDLTTLAGLDAGAGDLGGYGPVIAEVARKVALEQRRGEWSATVTDPVTGEPLHTVALRRRPSAAQRSRIRALHPTCCFIGCRMPAVESDIDHIDDRANGGPTTVRNQAPLCRRHHLAKHRGGWRYRKISRTRFEWTSPLGRRYRTGRPP